MALKQQEEDPQKTLDTDPGQSEGDEDEGQSDVEEDPTTRDEAIAWRMQMGGRLTRSLR